MTDRSLIHHTFTVERRYAVPIERVFNAWSDPEARRRWFTTGEGEHTLDFRVGGVELVRSVGDDQRLLVFESRYVDIVESRRIVYVSTLSTDGVLATTSVTSVELGTDGDGTVLTLTESAVFLDGQELPSWRERGTTAQLDQLGAELTGGR